MAISVLCRREAAIVAFSLSMAIPIVASANGDAFFRFDVFNLSETPLEEQTVYIGSVKDNNGNYIDDATITVGITVPTSRGDRHVTYNAYTNLIGRYRTLDVASVILALEEVEHDVDPRDVEVTVEKEGYTTVRRLDRSRSSQKGGVFEVDFIIARIVDANGETPR